MSITPVEATLLVAVCSLVIVPASIALIRHYLEQRRAAKQALLDKRYVPREEHEMQFETMAKVQATQHKENRDFLDTIRTEAHQREGKILGSIEAHSANTSLEIANLRTRVDTLFTQLGRG